MKTAKLADMYLSTEIANSDSKMNELLEVTTLLIGNGLIASSSNGCLVVGMPGVSDKAIVSGNGNVVFGQAKCYSPYNAFANGSSSTIARNAYSFAVGGLNYGYNSVTLPGGITGRESGNPFERTCGEVAFAHGTQANALGQYSHAEGRLTHTYAGSSHTEGRQTNTYGMYSHAEGYFCSTGDLSIRFENSNDFSGNRDATDGLSNLSIIGYASHAEGYNTIAYGKCVHAEGSTTKAIGEYSHAEGIFSRSYGRGAHAEGSYAIADGACSHAEGERVVAAGEMSHAEGAYSTTKTEATFRDYGSLNIPHGTIVQWTESGWVSCADYTHAGEMPYKPDVSAVTYSYGALNAMSNVDPDMHRLTGLSPVVGKYYLVTRNDPANVTLRWKFKDSDGQPCKYAYSWNGDYTWSMTVNGANGGRYYPAHGEGTYNINPKNGLSGFYIGEENFIECIVKAIEAASRDSILKSRLKAALTAIMN